MELPRACRSSARMAAPPPTPGQEKLTCFEDPSWRHRRASGLGDVLHTDALAATTNFEASNNRSRALPGKQNEAQFLKAWSASSASLQPLGGSSSSQTSSCHMPYTSCICRIMWLGPGGPAPPSPTFKTPPYSSSLLLHFGYNLCSRERHPSTIPSLFMLHVPARQVPSSAPLFLVAASTIAFASKCRKVHDEQDEIIREMAWLSRPRILPGLMLQYTITCQGITQLPYSASRVS